MTIFLYIPTSEFCPISGDWGKLWTSNLAQIFLMKFCWMLQNTRVTAFTVFELLRENQQGRGVRGVVKLLPKTTQIRVKLRRNILCHISVFIGWFGFPTVFNNRKIQKEEQFNFQWRYFPKNVQLWESFSLLFLQNYIKSFH